MKKVINVGGNNKEIPLPPEYEGWQHILLDVDPKGKPDILCDAREIESLKGDDYNAVYCSHNLEHYYYHDVRKVLNGFHHLLIDEGFVDIRVPDLDALMRIMIENNKDIDDFLYTSPAGPISVRDVIYGYGVEIEKSGSEYYAHKTGFTPKSLKRVLIQSGFPTVYLAVANLEVRALGFKSSPTKEIRRMFKI